MIHFADRQSLSRFQASSWGISSTVATRWVVIHVDPDDYCIVTHANLAQSPVHAAYAGEWLYRTPVEALQEAVRFDLNWHGKSYRRAKKCQKAIKAGADLSEFFSAGDEEDES